MEFSFLCFVIYLLPCSLAGAGAWDEGTSPLVVIHVAAGPGLKVVQFSFSLVLLTVFFLNLSYFILWFVEVLQSVEGVEVLRSEEPAG
jgi:hypothetical protein